VDLLEGEALVGDGDRPASRGTPGEGDETLPVGDVHAGQGPVPLEDEVRVDVAGEIGVGAELDDPEGRCLGCRCEDKEGDEGEKGKGGKGGGGAAHHGGYALLFYEGRDRFSGMDPPGRALVVKVGGSLISDFAEIMACLKESGRPILVVPGGGPFARLVRSMHLPDEPSHWMAILAMDQVGWVLAAGGVPVTHEIAIPQKVEVLLPYRVLRERDPLPHTWDVTSDTIAAWVAAELGLDLLLLKPVDGITKDGLVAPRISAPVPTDVVDRCLIPYALAHGVKVTLINGRVRDRIGGFLAGRKVPGTVIEPRV